MKERLTGILIVGMSFGTAWAIRGQFGHEQGAGDSRLLPYLMDRYLGVIN